MSIAQRLDHDELIEASTAELYRALGSHDTPLLFEQPVEVVIKFQVPAGGGNSLDRQRVYIDNVLYQEIMDGSFSATGLSPVQLLERIVDHEHTEIVIAQGDNPVDTYLPAHRRALRREHEGVLAVLGRDQAEAKIQNYERVIWPGLLRCYQRPVKNPPKDLWCGVYLDEPDDHDERILETMARLGVIDAQKRSKYETRYGVGGYHCRECSMWAPRIIASENGALAACTAVSGLVRHDRQCELWAPAKRQNSVASAA